MFIHGQDCYLLLIKFSYTKFKQWRLSCVQHGRHANKPSVNNSPYEETENATFRTFGNLINVEKMRYSLNKKIILTLAFISWAFVMPSTSCDICHKSFSRLDAMLRHKKKKLLNQYHSVARWIWISTSFYHDCGRPNHVGKIYLDEATFISSLRLSNKIIWLYKRWQPLYDELKDRVPPLEFIQELPDNLNSDTCLKPKITVSNRNWKCTDSLGFIMTARWDIVYMYILLFLY